jgi:radical SAM protein with 4Fe4S-binding SPASM domain
MMMERRDYGRYYGKCYGQQFASTIAADGNVYVCCHMRRHEKYCLGDLNEKTFAEIWDSEQRKRTIESINFADCIPLCRDNTFNQILWDLTQPREHENFL